MKSKEWLSHLHIRTPIVGLLICSIAESKAHAYEAEQNNRKYTRAALVVNLTLLLSILCEALLSEVFQACIGDIDFFDEDKTDGLKKYLLQRLGRTGWEELNGPLCEALLGVNLATIIGRDITDRLKALSQHRNLIAHGESVERTIVEKFENRHAIKTKEEKFGKEFAFQKLQEAGIIPMTGIQEIGLEDIYSIKTYEYFEAAVVEFATEFSEYLKNKHFNNMVTEPFNKAASLKTARKRHIR